MAKHLHTALRIVCLVLAGVVVVQAARLTLRKDPLAGWRMPSSSSEMAPVPPVKAGALPSAIQARVDRIVTSEIFGPVPRVAAIPVALIGIAGRDAFLRGTNGQTLLLRRGEESAGLKLLQIGTNRVLIEQDGQKKELTIFSGFGSQTLLPPPKENAP